MLVKAISKQITVHLVEQYGENMNLVSPAEILKDFNRLIKDTLDQDHEKNNADVGFDGCVIFYNKKDNILKYSGARLNLYCVDNAELITFKADKQSIGYKKSNVNYKFTDYIIPIDYKKYFYLSSDGYLDQLGGTKNFPYGRRKFEDIIHQNFYKSFDEQKQIFINHHSNWKGQREQNDDVTIVGFCCDKK